LRVLGIDFGSKRIGIALGESDHAVTSARPAIQASGTLKRDAIAIAEIAKREGAEALVVGLPLGDDDELSPIAKVALKLADKLKELGWDVHTVNEALTSVEAEGNLLRDDHKASVRRRLRDGEAARLILERYFHEQNQA
jgi:putative holliday junction resolvase